MSDVSAAPHRRSAAQPRPGRSLALTSPGELPYAIIHNALLVLCIYVLSTRLYTVFIGGGWVDRSQFFGDGVLRPTLIDFIFNELIVSYLIIRVVAFRFNLLVVILVALSSFAYFTRVPLILLFFALMLSPYISIYRKFISGTAILLISFVILYLRIGDILFVREDSSIFYLTYPLVGIGRLAETTQSLEATPLHYLALFLKPLDAVLFVIDYVQDRAGQLSAGRFVGGELVHFVYIQWLQGGYNAFGTILYPFILIAGWWVGVPLFILFIIFQYVIFNFATQNPVLSKSFIALLLTTGILFSWVSPFGWLAPFLFTKFRGRASAPAA